MPLGSRTLRLTDVGHWQSTPEGWTEEHAPPCTTSLKATVNPALPWFCPCIFLHSLPDVEASSDYHTILAIIILASFCGPACHFISFLEHSHAHPFAHTLLGLSLSQPQSFTKSKIFIILLRKKKYTEVYFKQK